MNTCRIMVSKHFSALAGAIRNKEFEQRKERMEESEPQLCFKNGAAALLTLSEDALQPCCRNRSRHEQSQLSRRLSHQERKTLLTKSKNPRTVSCSQPMQFLFRGNYHHDVYVVYGQDTAMFGMGRSVMSDGTCCNTDSESPSTRATRRPQVPC